MTSAPPDVHPSEIPGRTDEYRTFLTTWAGQMRGGPGVFQGHLNCLIQAELRSAGQDVVAYARDLMKENLVQWKAMDRLTTDLLAFLSTHDCVQAGHIGDGCPDGATLIERLMKARAILGLDRLATPVATGPGPATPVAGGGA